jgi:hypothetical protein
MTDFLSVLETSRSFYRYSNNTKVDDQIKQFSKNRLLALEEILPPYAAAVAHTAENTAVVVEHDRVVKLDNVTCVQD